MATSSEDGRVGTVEVGGSLLEAMLFQRNVLISRRLSFKRRQGGSIEMVGRCVRKVEFLLLGGFHGRVKHAGTGSLSLPFASWSGIVQSSYCPCRGPHPLPEFSSTALVQL